MLDNYSETTIGQLYKIFASTKHYEEDVDIHKDVSEFNDSEAFYYLKRLNSKSRERLKKDACYLSRYHQWCFEKGLIQNQEDAFQDKKIYKIIKEIVPNDILLESYFTKNDLIELIELDPDYINQFILLAIFYGIKGDNLGDLVNVKIGDLNEEEKTVTLVSGRKAYVDDYFIEVMKKANSTTVYKQNVITDNHKKPNQTVYEDSGYVIRKCILKNYSTTGCVNKKFVTQRIQKFKKEVDSSFITIPNLYNNGMIDFIQEKYRTQGISFKTALTYNNNGTYIYEKETNEYIKEFGSKTNARAWRFELKDIMNHFDEDIANIYNPDEIWKPYDGASVLTLERKMLDDKFFIIRNDIAESWGVDRIDCDKKSDCSLIYRDIKYKAYFYKQNMATSFIRLYRDTKFDIMLYDKFKNYGWRDKPMIRFVKLPDGDYSLNFILPDYLDDDIENEIDEDSTIEEAGTGGKEGKVKQYYSKKYERDRNNRIEALKIHGTVCQCCNFNFEKVYGDIGIGFIEIHHKKPLFSLNEEVKISPKDDLVPVCPNCHRIIHRKRDTVLTVEEVRELIRKNKVKD
jgi:5-methylcytosine-specific restriction protein A